MRYTSDEQRRYAFRDWLRAQLATQDFYQRRGNRYLVSEFARHAQSVGARMEEVSLGRYLRDENPVLPTPESCREIARALGCHPAEALMQAGYLTADDFFYLPSTPLDAAALARQMGEIDRYTYLPEPIRAQMKASLKRQIAVQRVATETSAAALPEGEPVEAVDTAILAPQTDPASGPGARADEQRPASASTSRPRTHD